MTSASKKHVPLLAFYAILFLVSGFAGLVYQVVWERLLQVFFGVTTVSITLIVGAYMAGLGLGSLFGGRLSQKLHSVLIAYGMVEIGIGAFGLISPALLLWVGRATAGSNYALVFILSFVLLIIPTFLMGMTLPLLTQGFVRRVEISGRVVGLLYGINTLGAAIGALITGFVLIGWLGLAGTTVIGFVLNAIVGLTAIGLVRRWGNANTGESPVKNENNIATGKGWRYSTILTASFLTGFLGLGYEMLWVRVVGILNKNTAYTFPTILFVFLMGLALGGYFWGSRADKTDARSLFWKLEIIGGLVAAGSLLVLWIALGNEPYASRFAETFGNYQNPASPYLFIRETYYVLGRRLAVATLFHYFMLPTLVIFPTAFFLGGGLPILDRIAIESPEVAGRRVGDVHLVNIIGSVLGTLLISFVFLRFFSSEWTLRILLLASLCFPALFLMEKRHGKQQELKSSAILIFLAFLAVILMSLVFPARGAFYTRIFETGVQRPAITDEGSDTVLALTMNSETNNPEFLFIGGESNSFYPPYGNYERTALTCAGVSQPHRILVIGFGGGNTTYFLTHLPGVEEIVVVELMEDLGSFLEENIPLVQAALDDPRVHYIHDDGRRWLYAHPYETFDMISLDPLRSTTVGHDNLYSLEAMTLYQNHLNPQGVLCTWDDEGHRNPATAAQVFPYVDAYRGHFIASNDPIIYSLSYMETAREVYLHDAEDVVAPQTADIINPTNIFQQFRRDQDQIRVSEAGVLPITDMHPWLEYYFFNPPVPGTPPVDPASLQAFLDRIVGCDQACRQAITSH